MSEMRRLLHEGSSPAARALLEAGLEDAPPGGAFERTATILGVVGATATFSLQASGAAGASAAAAGASGGTQTTLTSLVAKWLLIGAAGGTAVSGTAALVVQSEPASRAAITAGPATRAAARPAPARAPSPWLPAVLPAAVPEAAPAGLPPAFESVRGAHQPYVTPRGMPEDPAIPMATTGSAALPDQANPLGVEVGLIDAARRALAASDPARALAALDRHAREQRTGVLDREARLIRIDALALAGDHGTAAALAAAYLRELPADPHAPRLRTLVSGAPR